MTVMMQALNRDATACFVLCTHPTAFSLNSFKATEVASCRFTSSESVCGRRVVIHKSTDFHTTPLHGGSLRPARPTKLRFTPATAKRPSRMSSSRSSDQEDVSTPITGGTLGTSVNGDETPVSKPESVATSETVIEEQPVRGPFGRFKRWYGRMVEKRSALRAGALRNYGIAAFLSYGFFDFITYTISFLFSLRAFVASGKTLTWQTLPQVLALMWGINNLSRPFRIAGALALAPVVDRRVVKPISAFFSRVFSRNRTENSSEVSSAPSSESSFSSSQPPPPQPSPPPPTTSTSSS